MQFIQITGGAGSRQFFGMPDVLRLASKIALAQHSRHTRLTLLGGDNTVGMMANSVSNIQIGQWWKKDDTGETFLVARVDSEALRTMVHVGEPGSGTEAWG